MAEIRLVKLRKEFKSTVAVQDINLEIKEGEFLVLVGPSGCGKTTTLRLIAGLEEPTGGTVRIGDRVVNSLPPRSRDVAMVFQRPALYPHLNVRENLAFGLRMRRQGWLSFRGTQQQRQEDAQRVREVARVLGLEDVLER